MGDLIDARDRFKLLGDIALRGMDKPDPINWRMEYDALWRRYVMLEDELARSRAEVYTLEDEVSELLYQLDQGAPN